MYNLKELTVEKEILETQHKDILGRIKEIDNKIESHLRNEFVNSITGKYFKNIYTGELIHVREITWVWKNNEPGTVIYGDILGYSDEEKLKWIKKSEIDFGDKINSESELFMKGWEKVTEEEWEEVKNKILETIKNELPRASRV